MKKNYTLDSIEAIENSSPLPPYTMLKKSNYKDQLIVKNALLNAFVDAYLYEKFGIYLGYIFVNKRDIRIVNTHMKLTGKSFLEELKRFVEEFEEKDRAYDFVLDSYGDFEVEEYWSFKST